MLLTKKQKSPENNTPSPTDVHVGLLEEQEMADMLAKRLITTSAWSLYASRRQKKIAVCVTGLRAASRTWLIVNGRKRRVHVARKKRDKPSANRSWHREEDIVILRGY